MKKTLQQVMQKYKRSYEQPHANKMDNLEEMDKFLEKYNLPKLNPEDVFFCKMLLLLLFSCWVVSYSLQPHGRQPTRLPRPLSPTVCSNSCLLSRWCYLTISSSSVLFFFCLQSSILSLNNFIYLFAVLGLHALRACLYFWWTGLLFVVMHGLLLRSRL